MLNVEEVGWNDGMVPGVSVNATELSTPVKKANDIANSMLHALWDSPNEQALRGVPPHHKPNVQMLTVVVMVSAFVTSSAAYADCHSEYTGVTMRDPELESTFL